MRKVAGLVFLAGMLMAAAPPHDSALSKAPVLVEATISPTATYPASSDEVASADVNGYTAAPVPDSDEQAPVVHSSEPAQAEWSPNLFSAAKTYRGEGYVPGSSVQASQQRNVHPAPGISLKVPLE